MTGTPSAAGTASFTLSLGGQTCTLSLPVLPIGSISSLNCGSATSSGALTAGVTTSGVSSSIPYTGGNGGTYNGQTVTSTGVTGLTATLTAGTLATGAGTITYTITGTPSAAGTASFTLNIGGQTCMLSRIVNTGVITALNCSSATNSGTITNGNVASAVSSSIPYTGGNGGPYNDQTVNSTGVTGLTATLTAGTFAIGTGSLNYTINGTPSAAGTANFALTIGGQSCTLNWMVVGGTPATCGATNVHNPNLTYGSITDQDGNIYKTIVIGTQEWMAENLKASHYRNGDLIPVVTNAATWAGLTSGASCWNNNDSATYNCPYGKLYNWYAATDSRNVCPSGWHLPSDAEFTVLKDYLGGGPVAGGKMKSTGTQFWPSPNTDATNESGFSGLPSGSRINAGVIINDFVFNPIGFSDGRWWSSTDYSTESAFQIMVNFSGNASIDGNPKTWGFSVGCVKD
jgi:uncharacterized protein (TIGR02145 family)